MGERWMFWRLVLACSRCGIIDSGGRLRAAKMGTNVLVVGLSHTIMDGRAAELSAHVVRVSMRHGRLHVGFVHCHRYVGGLTYRRLTNRRSQPSTLL